MGCLKEWQRCENPLTPSPSPRFGARGAMMVPDSRKSCRKSGLARTEPRSPVSPRCCEEGRRIA
jgi:hypothetical protein